MPSCPTLLLAAALLLAGMPPAIHAEAIPARTGARPVPTSFAPAFQRGSAWSVGIYVFVPGEDEPHVAAGFFIDDKGSIATAAHVLGEGQQILVALPDKRLLAARLQGLDETADIALLRVDTPPHVSPILARTGSLQVGDWVMAVGEPFGLEHSVAAGIVSGKDRHFGDDGELLFIQSDVALNPGNSGGPLLDMTGAIVGMNARTIVGPIGTPGASLAIPIAIVMQVVAEIRQDATLPPRPRLGAQYDDIPPFTAWAAGRRDLKGALILTVPHGSLAERLRLRAGDIVTMMNGRAIGGSADLVNTLLAWRTVADTVIAVQREGRELVLRLE